MGGRRDDLPLELQQQTPGTLVFAVDLKWSLWTTNERIWRDRAPDAWMPLRAGIEDGCLEESGDRLVIHTAPRKEIRFGTVELWFDGEHNRLKATINFSAEWDEVPDLLDALGFDRCDKQAEELLRATLAETGVDMSGESPTITVSESHTYRPDSTLDEVLLAIDDVENRLLLRETDAWSDLVNAFDGDPRES